MQQTGTHFTYQQEAVLMTVVCVCVPINKDCFAVKYLHKELNEGWAYSKVRCQQFED